MRTIRLLMYNAKIFYLNYIVTPLIPLRVTINNIVRNTIVVKRLFYKGYNAEEISKIYIRWLEFTTYRLEQRNKNVRKELWQKYGVILK